MQSVRHSACMLAPYIPTRCTSLTYAHTTRQKTILLMSGSTFTDSIAEDAHLARVQALGYAVPQGPDIAAGEQDAERVAAESAP